MDGRPCAEAKREWVDSLSRMLDACHRSTHKKSDASQLFAFLAITRQFWCNEERFSTIVRTKLEEFHTKEKWEEAVVFYQMLFPDDEVGEVCMN